eukprot:scaffold2600_cov238-Pinguiococcus_pyrenoidosus.AAC.6
MFVDLGLISKLYWSCFRPCFPAILAVRLRASLAACARRILGAFSDFRLRIRGEDRKAAGAGTDTNDYHCVACLSPPSVSVSVCASCFLAFPQSAGLDGDGALFRRARTGAKAIGLSRPARRLGHQWRDTPYLESAAMPLRSSVVMSRAVLSNQALGEAHDCVDRLANHHDEDSSMLTTRPAASCARR